MQTKTGTHCPHFVFKSKQPVNNLRLNIFVIDLSCLPSRKHLWPASQGHSTEAETFST